MLRQTEALFEADRCVVDAQVADDAARDRLTPAQLEQAAARRALAVDPEAAAKRAAKARSLRSVSLGDPIDGVAGVAAELRAEEALACWTSLDRTARRMRQDGDGGSLQELMADLFVERLTGTALVPVDDARAPVWRCVDGREPWTCSSPPPVVPDPDPHDPAWNTLVDEHVEHASPQRPLPARPPPKRRLPISVELQVVMSAATLLGSDDEPALLRGYGPVAADVAREIADMASRRTLIGLFSDPVDGRLLAMDSASRFYSGRLRDFCLWRDQWCRLSGGRIRDVDHRDESRKDGPTSARNGQAFGRLSHVVKDHPGVRGDVVQPALVGDGLDPLRRHAPDVSWTMPTGHRYAAYNVFVVECDRAAR